MEKGNSVFVWEKKWRTIGFRKERARKKLKQAIAATELCFPSTSTARSKAPALTLNYRLFLQKWPGSWLYSISIGLWSTEIVTIGWSRKWDSRRSSNSSVSLYHGIALWYFILLRIQISASSMILKMCSVFVSEIFVGWIVERIGWWWSCIHKGGLLKTLKLAWRKCQLILRLLRLLNQPNL